MSARKISCTMGLVDHHLHKLRFCFWTFAVQCQRIIARWQGGKLHSCGSQRVGRDAMPGAKTARAVTDQRRFKLDADHCFVRSHDGADDQLPAAAKSSTRPVPRERRPSPRSVRRLSKVAHHRVISVIVMDHANAAENLASFGLAIRAIGFDPEIAAASVQDDVLRKAFE